MVVYTKFGTMFLSTCGIVLYLKQSPNGFESSTNYTVCFSFRLKIMCDFIVKMGVR